MYTVTFTETNSVTVAQKLAGLTAALNEYNAQNPNHQLTDEAAYVQYVMDIAAESYAKQYNIV